MTTQILQGDSLEVLKSLDPESVNCVITSPPYYGLRDYGTGTWEGGDPNCDHVANANKTKIMGNSEFNKSRPSRAETKTAGYYEKVCPKCGAIRKDNQIGMEETPEAYIEKLVQIFREVRRVLRKDGTVWLNIGDTYNGAKKGNTEIYKNKRVSESNHFEKKLWSGAKTKDLIGIPWMLAFALRADGWYLRQDIIWEKGNPMPESVTDRCTKSHEYIFLLSKSPKYYFDFEAIKEPCSQANIEDFKRRKTMNNKGAGKGTYEEARPDLNRNREAYMPKDFMRRKRDVWRINTKPYKGAHFATFPEDLVIPCLLAGCPEGGTALDIFSGAGTVGVVCKKNKRNFIGIELNPEYIALATARIENTPENPHTTTIQSKNDRTIENQISLFNIL